MSELICKEGVTELEERGGRFQPLPIFDESDETMYIYISQVIRIQGETRQNRVCEKWLEIRNEPWTNIQ